MREVLLDDHYAISQKKKQCRHSSQETSNLSVTNQLSSKNIISNGQLWVSGLVGHLFLGHTRVNQANSPSFLGTSDTVRSFHSRVKQLKISRPKHRLQLS